MHQVDNYKSTSCGTNAHLSGAIIVLKKGHNSKNIAFKVIPLALQLHLAIMSKYSKFDVDTLNTS